MSDIENTIVIGPNGKRYSKVVTTVNNEERISWELVEDSGLSEEMQRNIRLLRCHNKLIQMKVTLLDEYYIEVESLIGKVKGYPSYDIDADSDIRRTCSLVLSVPAKEQIELDFEETWNNRMVKLACGIYDWEEKEYVWYDLGIMLMTSGESIFDATTQDIKLNLVDPMATMTQERGSQIGETYLFQAGDNIKNLVEAVVVENSMFNATDVCEFDDTMPYDVSSEQGNYAIDVLHLIFDLFPYYEFFYDNTGTFIAQQIPMKITDPVDIGNDILDDLIISEKKTVDFSQIKNTTEIWGRELSGDYIAIECITSGDTYNVTIDETFTELVSGEKYTVVPLTDSVSGQKMKIQDTPAYQIYTVNGAGTTYTPIEVGAMKAGVGYVIRYFEEKFVLEGELLVRCIVQEITEMPSLAVQQAYKNAHSCNNVKWIVNPDSPFACTLSPSTGNIQGEIRQVLTGGEFENIYTVQLAYERAQYENWLRCRQQDTVEVEMILVPWMDINDKIQYTSPISGDVVTWLVKGISYEFNNWTMTVKAARFYPYYPWD